MIASSSNRIIKHPDAAGLIKQYIPLAETVPAGEPVVKKASFPHLTLEGKEKKEEFKEPLSEADAYKESEAAQLEEAASAQEALNAQWEQEAREA